MRILAVADIHGAQYRLNLVLNNVAVHKPDLVVVCGDITQFGPGELATTLLNQIPVRTFAIPGNIDTFDVDQGIEASHATNLHLKHVVVQGVPFVGIGREIPAPITDPILLETGEKKPLKTVLDRKSVLVTHVPPYKLQDRIFIGTHGGSRELHSILDAAHPRVVLCGHIHEDPGVTQMEKTTVVNCSLGKRTEGALVEINKSVKITILD
ncbi:MAG: metallophosphoesterase family protein [Candidatus Thermoplasmatota archaeon]|nr:metallophosphoesterase family protein [Candidatus Thermoplasmatota archaeon]